MTSKYEAMLMYEKERDDALLVYERCRTIFKENGDKSTPEAIEAMRSLWPYIPFLLNRIDELHSALWERTCNCMVASSYLGRFEDAGVERPDGVDTPSLHSIIEGLMKCFYDGRITCYRSGGEYCLPQTKEEREAGGVQP